MAAIKLIIVKYVEDVEAPQGVIPAFYDPQKRRVSELVLVLVW